MPPAQSPPPADHSVDTLMSAARALVGLTVLSLTELQDEISLPQFRALVVLSDSGTLNASELGRRLGVSASSVTRLSDRLVADGLMERRVSPHSRREVLLAVAQPGRALVDRVMQRRRRHFGEVLAAISPDKHESVVRAMRIFADQAYETHGIGLADEWGAA